VKVVNVFIEKVEAQSSPLERVREKVFLKYRHCDLAINGDFLLSL